MRFETRDVGGGSSLSVPKARGLTTQDNPDEAPVQDELLGSLGMSAKGDPDKDPLSGQTFVRSRVEDLSERERDAIHDTSWITDRIIDQHAEYATRNGATVSVAENDRISEENAAQIEGWINDWLEDERNPVFETLEKLVETERHEGVGFVWPVTEEAGDQRWKDPLSERPTALHTFNVVGGDDLHEWEINSNPFTADYGGFDWIKVQYRTREDTYKRVKVHPSRFHFVRPRESKSASADRDGRGLSVYRRMTTTLKAFMNAEWAAGQAVYQSVLKILKTDLSSMDSRRQLEVAQNMLQEHMNALSLAMIDKNDEELEFAGSGQATGGMAAYLEFLKEMLAAATQTPKSVLFGQQQGEVSGAEKDTQVYFSRIGSYRDRYLSPALRFMIDVALRTYGEIIPTDSTGGPVIPPSAVEYAIEWNPIFEPDEKRKAQVAKLEAETQRIQTQRVVEMASRGAIGIPEATEMLQRINRGETLDDIDLPDEGSAASAAERSIGEYEHGTEDEGLEDSVPA